MTIIGHFSSKRNPYMVKVILQAVQPNIFKNPKFNNLHNITV